MAVQLTVVTHCPQLLLQTLVQRMQNSKLKNILKMLVVYSNPDRALFVSYVQLLQVVVHLELD